MTPDESNRSSIRTLRKREAMLKAAWKIFSEHGYERTSMDMVIAMSGGSKATLYSYFKSKEELLIATVHFRLQELTKSIHLELREDLPFPEALYLFGMQYTKMLLHSDFLEVYRLAAAESNNTPLGAEVFEPGFKRKWDQITAFFAKRIDPARLFPGGAWTASMHLKGLLDSELVLYRLWDVMDRAPNKDVEVNVRAGVEAFLRIYAPDEHLSADFKI